MSLFPSWFPKSAAYPLYTFTTNQLIPVSQGPWQLLRVFPKTSFPEIWRWQSCPSTFKSWGNSCPLGFPGSSDGKESACNAGDPGSIPGLGRSTGERIGYPLQYSWASLVAELVKNPPAMRETWLQSLGWEDSLEKGTATYSSILAWRKTMDCMVNSTTELHRTEQLSLFTFSCPSESNSRLWASKLSGTFHVQVRPLVKSLLLPDLVQDGSPLQGKIRAETEWLTTWTPQTCWWPAPLRRRPASSGCVTCPRSAASLCLTPLPAWTYSVGAGPGSITGGLRALQGECVRTSNIWKANLSEHRSGCWKSLSSKVKKGGAGGQVPDGSSASSLTGP